MHLLSQLVDLKYLGITILLSGSFSINVQQSRPKCHERHFWQGRSLYPSCCTMFTDQIDLFTYFTIGNKILKVK